MQDREPGHSERIERLERQVKRLTEALEEIIIKNIPLNALLYHGDSEREARQPFKLRFDGPIEVPNVYQTETWKGKIFRWLGPERSTTLTIPRDRSVGYDLRITVPHFTGGLQTLSATMIMVDGVAVATGVTGEGDVKIISAVIPPQPSQVQFPAFLLTIEYPRAIQLHEPDARMATLAVSEIAIIPRQ